MKITVDEFCELTGIERNVGYGFLRWMAEAGYVDISRSKGPRQTRGKPANYYDFGDASLPDKVHAALEQMLDEIAAFKEEESDQVLQLEVATHSEESVSEEEIEELGEVASEEQEDEEDQEFMEADREYLVS